MLAKAPKSDGPLDLDAVRRELVEAQAKLDAILARELASTDTAAAFNEWRAERDAAIAEVERLSKLIERLESVANEDTLREQRAALQKRMDAQRKSNDALARRIQQEGAAAIEALLKLARDIAAAAIVDAGLNAEIRDDSDKIVGADMLARYRQPAPRENISKTEVALWAFAANGSVVGAQDEVIELDDGTGYLIGSAHHRTYCVKRRFRSIEFLEAEPRQQHVPFFAALRLPSPDGPGLVWDPRDGLSAAAAVETLKRRPAIAERETLTELVPVEPFIPQPASTGWNRAGHI